MGEKTESGKEGAVQNTQAWRNSSGEITPVSMAQEQEIGEEQEKWAHLLSCPKVVLSQLDRLS